MLKTGVVLEVLASPPSSLSYEPISSTETHETASHLIDLTAKANRDETRPGQRVDNGTAGANLRFSRAPSAYSHHFNLHSSPAILCSRANSFSFLQSCASTLLMYASRLRINKCVQVVILALLFLSLLLGLNRFYGVSHLPWDIVFCSSPKLLSMIGQC
jgi:hypothetical protein